MGTRIDLTGKRYGKLVAIRPTGHSGNSAVWVVKCDCGKEAEKKAKYLLNGDTKSCGCLLARDGRTNTRIYSIWQTMMTRCYNKNAKSYPYYGGDGVVVCDRWHDFKNFFEDTQEGYADNLTLDRFPNRKGNYEPGNTRWADTYQQAKNKDRTKLYAFDGQMLCVPEIAKITGVSKYAIYGKLLSGYTIEEAVRYGRIPYSRKNGRSFTINGVSKTIVQLSNEYGISYDMLHHRLVNLKMNVEDAVSLKEKEIRYSKIKCNA